MNFHCDKIFCLRNTGISSECKCTIDKELFKSALTSDTMCPRLKSEVFKIYIAVLEVFKEAGGLNDER